MIQGGFFKKRLSKYLGIWRIYKLSNTPLIKDKRNFCDGNQQNYNEDIHYDEINKTNGQNMIEFYQRRKYIMTDLK